MEFMLVNWQIWLILALLCFIVEIFSNTFVFLCFCVGCLVSTITALFTESIIIQILVFSIVTLISLIFVRPIINKYAFRKSNDTKTNVDALIGAEVRVIETIDDISNTGRVFVNGDDWKAVSVDNQRIEKDKKISVVKVESNILIVKQIN